MGRESASYFLTIPPDSADGIVVALQEGGAELVGDFTAPISADHVYMYIHQTRSKRDNDAELEWHREREISRIEQMWDGEPKLPPDHPDNR